MKEQVTFEDIKTHLSEFLADHQLMSVATSGAEGLWIATVYYAIDEQFCFYFVSDPQKVHSKHIILNSHVAWAINDSQQTPKKMKEFNKCGVQCAGYAIVLEDKNEIEKGLLLWKEALNISSDEYFSVENIMTGKITQKIFKLTPQKLRFFNEELFSEEETPLFTLE